MLNSFMKASSKWTLAAGSAPRAEVPLWCSSCRTCLIASRLLVCFHIYPWSPSWGGQMLSLDRTELLRGGGGCVCTTKSRTKIKLNHVGHQFYLIFHIFLSGLALPITCPECLWPSYSCSQRHWTPLRKSTAWTLVVVWIQTEHDWADTPAQGSSGSPSPENPVKPISSMCYDGYSDPEVASRSAACWGLISEVSMSHGHLWQSFGLPKVTF